MSRLFAGTSFDRPQNCPTCGKAPADCRCLTLPDKKQTTGNPGKKAAANKLVITPQNGIPPADQVAKIRVEKRKGNREATVVTGLEHPANDLAGLCTELKQMLGTGGSVQGRVIEIQGDHAAKVGDFLEVEKGITVRVSK
jgi:translation initiation factor 1